MEMGMNELHQLFHQPEFQGKRNKPIRPKLIRKFWNNNIYAEK
jgi:hypothetical protein